MLLLDARIEVKEADTEVMELLDRAAVTFQLVLTKADGVKPAALARKQAEATRWRVGIRRRIRTSSSPAARPAMASPNCAQRSPHWSFNRFGNLDDP